MTATNPGIDASRIDVIGYREQIRSLKEMILANLVMVSEIPAQTFHETDRVAFLLDRFRESGLDNVSSDQADNALAVLHGSEPGRSILVAAHVDTLAPQTADHTVKVSSDTLGGAGIVDNSLGVAAMISLPTILDRLGIRLKSDLVLVGASRSLGRGNLEGIQFFLKHHQAKGLQSGIFLEGAQLGRLSYKSSGMLRAEITCEFEEDPLPPFGAVGPLCDVVQTLQTIPLPQKPKTTITIGRIESGKSFNLPARTGRIQLEVRSEQVGMITRIQSDLSEIVRQVASEYGVRVEMREIARCRPGGIEFRHPLTVATRDIMETLGVEPVIQPSVGELSALIAHEIPGVTIGLTESVPDSEPVEQVRIEPMFSGLAQLVGLLVAIDEGICDEE